MSATEDSVAGFASRDQPRDSVRYPSLSQYRQNPEQEDDMSDAPQAEEQIETNNCQQSIADIDSQLAEEDRALREDRPPDLEHDPNLAWIDRKINLTQSTLYTTLREFRKLAATVTSGLAQLRTDLKADNDKLEKRSGHRTGVVTAAAITLQHSPPRDTGGLYIQAT
ncbi:hypothetical protein VTI28DRAFT_8521 [Corynascus sepedonium]